MKFLPYENYYLTTKLTPSQVTFTLKDNIIAPSQNIFRFNTNTAKPYEGYLEGNRFEISRIINYRNSFLPIINGQINSYGNGSRIHVKMRMHAFVSALMFVWLGFVTLLGSGIINLLLREKRFYTDGFFILFMFLFGYGLTVGGFKYESAKSKKFLAYLLQVGTNISFKGQS